jgi:hypothetical protein
MTVSARKNAPQLIHEISVALNAASVNGGVSIPVGAVGPSQVCLQAYHAVTSQAFDPTTVTLALGITQGGAEILAATSIKALGRLDGNVPFSATGFLPNTTIWATLAQTGGPATTGLCTVWVEYLAGPG